MAKILITGASGFIGSFMVSRALCEGFEVWAAVRPTSSRRYLQDEQIHFIELNLDNDRQLKNQIDAFRAEHGTWDYVIHTAGATKCRSKSDFYRINTDGTARLARTLIESGALTPEGRFIFISSLSVFGAVHDHDYAPISEKDIPAANTAYGYSKLKAENLLKEIKGLNYIVLRPTGVYGPREKDYFMMAQSIKRHIDFAVGYRPQVLTFIYVEDLVQAAFLALTHGASGRSYLLSDGLKYTSRSFSDLLQAELGVKHVLHITAPLWFLRIVSFVAENFARLTGSASTLNSDKYNIMSQRNWLCDITPARKELGYEPQWPLERGVRAAVAWYRKAGWL